MGNIKDEKIAIAKRKVSQAVGNLDVQQTGEIERYVRKIKDKKWTKQRAEQKQKRFMEVRSWKPGTKVVCSSYREPDFDSKVGIISRHLGRGSNRTAVDFDEKIGGHNIWHIPSIWLSKATPENIKRIQETALLNIGLGGILTKALNKME